MEQHWQIQIPANMMPADYMRRISCSQTYRIGRPENAAKHWKSMHNAEVDISASMPAGAARSHSLHDQHTMKRTHRDQSSSGILSHRLIPSRSPYHWNNEAKTKSSWLTFNISRGLITSLDRISMKPCLTSASISRSHIGFSYSSGWANTYLFLDYLSLYPMLFSL